MRKIFLLLFIPILLIGCKKDGAALLFDAAPEERMAQQLAELENKLLESEGAWKASLNTGTSTNKGAYNFYIDFNNDNTCKMQGDLTNETASVWHETTYRIIWAMNASLLFDTFTYITMLQEPSNSYGGTAPHGYRSDIEFEYIRSTTDSVFFKGKKYSHDLVLTKIGQNEVTALDNGGLLDMRNEVIDYFAVNTNAYFQTDSDIKYAVAIDRAAKAITVTWLDNQGNVQSRTSGFAYSLRGIDIFQPIPFNETLLHRIDFDNDAVKMVSDAGTYEIENSSAPILPITMLFASNGAYKDLYIGSSLPAGIVSGFNTAYQSSVNKFAAMNPTRTLVDVRFRLVNSTTATVTTRNNNGTTTFTAVATYNYTYVDDIITLTNPTYDGNWSARTTQLIDIQNYFLTGPFRVDYVISSDPSVRNIGGLYRVSDASSFFYGALQ